MKSTCNWWIAMLIMLVVITDSSAEIKENQNRRFQNLVRWAMKHGAIQNKIKLKYLFGDNRYIVANKNIRSGENIHSMPDSMILSSDHPTIKPFCEKKKEADVQKCLSLYVCNELQNINNSYFKHFLKFLPHDYHSFPYFYNNHELHLLENSQVMKSLKTWKKIFTEEYEAITSHEYKNFSLQDYAKCRHIVWSRNFSVKKSEKETSVIVPICDLYNFHPQKINVYWYYDSTNQAFKMDANTDIQKMEEIIVPYGSHPNNHYLFYYGFTIENNTDRLAFEYTYDKQQIILPNPPELEKVIPLYNGNLSSKSGEILGLEKMKGDLISIIDSYPTTLAQDKISYKKSMRDKNFNLTNIYRVLIEEKELLNDYIKLISDCIDYLKLGKPEKLDEWALKNISLKYIRYLFKKFSKYK